MTLIISYQTNSCHCKFLNAITFAVAVYTVVVGVNFQNLNQKGQ